MKDYKEKVAPPQKISGGLGPNIGSEEWRKRNERAEAMKQYAKKIDRVNKQREAVLPKPEKPQPVRSKAPTELAKEYSKQIPKPKPKPKPEEKRGPRRSESLGI